MTAPPSRQSAWSFTLRSVSSANCFSKSRPLLRRMPTRLRHLAADHPITHDHVRKAQPDRVEVGQIAVRVPVRPSTRARTASPGVTRGRVERSVTSLMSAAPSGCRPAVRVGSSARAAHEASDRHDRIDHALRHRRSRPGSSRTPSSRSARPFTVSAAFMSVPPMSSPQIIVPSMLEATATKVSVRPAPGTPPMAPPPAAPSDRCSRS